MPKEYTDCVEMNIKDGKSKKDAQKTCAIAYYKKHGMTPKEAEAKSETAYEEKDILAYEKENNLISSESDKKKSAPLSLQATDIVLTEFDGADLFSSGLNRVYITQLLAMLDKPCTPEGMQRLGENVRGVVITESAARQSLENYKTSLIGTTHTLNHEKDIGAYVGWEIKDVVKNGMAIGKGVFAKATIMKKKVKPMESQAITQHYQRGKLGSSYEISAFDSDIADDGYYYINNLEWTGGATMTSEIVQPAESDTIGIYEMAAKTVTLGGSEYTLKDIVKNVIDMVTKDNTRIDGMKEQVDMPTTDRNMAIHGEAGHENPNKEVIHQMTEEQIRQLIAEEIQKTVNALSEKWQPLISQLENIKKERDESVIKSRMERIGAIRPFTGDDLAEIGAEHKARNLTEEQFEQYCSELAEKVQKSVMASEEVKPEESDKPAEETEKPAEETKPEESLTAEMVGDKPTEEDNPTGLSAKISDEDSIESEKSKINVHGIRTKYAI